MPTSVKFALPHKDRVYLSDPTQMMLRYQLVVLMRKTGHKAKPQTNESTVAEWSLEPGLSTSGSGSQQGEVGLVVICRLLISSGKGAIIGLH